MEFAIVGSLALLVLLGAIEMSRLLFVMNTMSEVTRRGARMAAVCPINDPKIAQAAVFNNAGGANSPIISGLSTANIQLEYLNINGVPITTDLTDPAEFITIRYVRVQIVNYQHQYVLPIPMGPMTMPPMPATIPRESLGVPRNEPVQAC